MGTFLTGPGAKCRCLSGSNVSDTLSFVHYFFASDFSLFLFLWKSRFLFEAFSFFSCFSNICLVKGRSETKGVGHVYSAYLGSFGGKKKAKGRKK